MASQYFDLSAIPAMRTAQLALAGGRPATVVEVAVPPFPNRALAIVLDMSDSCSDMRAELRLLPKLVEAMPGAWALWVYRISESAPLQEAFHLTIGDIQKQFVNPASWLENEVNVRAGRAAGSFICPVLESIEQRRTCCGLDSVPVLVFSDGELLDLCPSPVPLSLGIVGITPSVEVDKMKHWQRVLPGYPLYSILDMELPNALAQWAYPFHGQCEISWQCGECRIRGYQLDVYHNSLRSLEHGPLTHNLADKPAYFVFETSAQEFATMQMNCVIPRSGVTVRLSPFAPLPPLPPALVQTIEFAMGIASSLPCADVKLA